MKRYFPYLVVLLLMIGSFYLGRVTIDTDVSNVSLPNPLAPAACGVQECHGLDLTCGSDIPQACTAMYQLGDGCMQYFQCGAVDSADEKSTCAPAPNARFQECKTCVERCIAMEDDPNDPSRVFECESTCVQK